MAVTKEQVEAEAKKLGIQLSEDKVKGYVLIGELPTKVESGSTTEDEEEEDEEEEDDTKLTAGARARIQKLNKQKKEARKEAADAAKVIADYKEKERLADEKTNKDKGDYEALNKTATEAKIKAEEVVKRTRERFKASAIQSAVESAILAAGLDPKRLAKALKLFEMEKVEFAWTDEENLAYEIDDFDDLVTEFKKENDFWFAEAGDDDDEPSSSKGSSGFKGQKPPNSGGKKEKLDEKEKRIRSQFGALR